MRSIDDVWNEIQSCPEPSDKVQEMKEVYETLLFSPYDKFEEIKDFLEKVDQETLKAAIWEIQCIPSMEAGDDDSYNEGLDRYHLYQNVLRECNEISSFQHYIWKRAKPKKKKRFF